MMKYIRYHFKNVDAKLYIIENKMMYDIFLRKV